MFKTTCRFLFSISTFLFAFMPAAFADMEDVPTIADVANTLIVGTDFVTRLLLLAAMVMGIGFFIFSISSYRQHRLTPKLVPLDRPVFYFVLGICLCALPFLGEIFGVKTYSTLDLKKQQRMEILTNHQHKKSTAYYDIDAPLETLEKH